MIVEVLGVLSVDLKCAVGSRALKRWTATAVCDMVPVFLNYGLCLPLVV